MARAKKQLQKNKTGQTELERNSFRDAFLKLGHCSQHEQLSFVIVATIGRSYMRLRPRTNRLAIPRMCNVLSVDVPASVRYTIIFKFLRAW